MCQRSIFSRSCIRLAEEVQLQAEEEWIIECLKKIKQQRNCLQIERLHLESLKLQPKNPDVSADEKKQSACPETTKESVTSTHSRRTEQLSAVDMMTLGSLRHNDDLANIDDDMQCNNEKLNLNLNFTSSCYNIPKSTYNHYDEHSDDDSSDLSDEDNMMIDINMLMNGNVRCNKRETFSPH